MNKIWITGVLACLSAVAVAQSAQSNDKATTPGQSGTAPNAASGQTAGKRMHKPVTISKDDSSNKASATVQGGKMASDDWHAVAAKSTDPAPSNPKTGTAQPRVAVGDVNGDGVADATAKNSGHATEKLTSATASSNVTQPRDAASGQASGKRQHEPATATKESDAKPKQK